MKYIKYTLTEEDKNFVQEISDEYNVNYEELYKLIIDIKELPINFKFRNSMHDKEFWPALINGKVTRIDISTDNGNITIDKSSPFFPLFEHYFLPIQRLKRIRTNENLAIKEFFNKYEYIISINKVVWFFSELKNNFQKMCAINKCAAYLKIYKKTDNGEPIMTEAEWDCSERLEQDYNHYLNKQNTGLKKKFPEIFGK